MRPSVVHVVDDGAGGKRMFGAESFNRGPLDRGDGSYIMYDWLISFAR